MSCISSSAFHGASDGAPDGTTPRGTASLPLDALQSEAFLPSSSLPSSMLSDALLSDALLSDALLSDALLSDALLSDASLSKPSLQWGESNLQLSSSLSVRILLTSAPSPQLGAKMLIAKAKEVVRCHEMTAQNVAQETTQPINDSSTRKDVGAPHSQWHDATHHARHNVSHDGFYYGFEDGSASASALPPPFPTLVDATCDAPDAPDAQNSEHDEGMRLQNLLECAGHQVVMWPEGTSSLMNAQDLMAFEIVIVQARRNAMEESLALCRFLRDATIEAGACLLVMACDERGSADASHHAAQMTAAGADGILDGAAPPYEIAAMLHALTQMARLRRELQVTREQLRLQLQNDDVTNLLNRRFFFQAAYREYERARRTKAHLSCVMIGVNHFRQMSENFGFGCCDAALREIACILRDFARDGDIVARFGEAKFVLLLPDTPHHQALRLSEAIQRRIATYAFPWQGQALHLSVSIGEGTRHLASAEETEFDATEFGANNLIIAPQNAEERKISKSETRAFDAAMKPQEAHAPREPLSTREEVAALLEEADAALFVAKRGVRNSSLAVSTALSLTLESFNS